MRFLSNRWLGRVWGRPALAMAFLGLVGLSYFWGRSGAVPKAEAVPPPVAQTAAPVVPSSSSDYGQRVVAYYDHNGTKAVTREMLGEYLIARGGADKLTLLVNKLIIADACREKGIEVTAAEVDAALNEDLRGMQNLPLKEFVDKVLKQYNKTLYEWKEDVIRPRLLLTKLIRPTVQVTQEDYQAAFDAYYGEKVECRMIMWPLTEGAIAMKEYEKIRDSEAEFDRKATHQASSALSSSGGRIQPIARRTTGSDILEKEAFRLQPGELSSVISTPQGHVVLKCIKRMPQDTSKKLEQEKPNLEKEIFDKKVQAAIPAYFQGLREKAQVKLLLKTTPTEEEFHRSVQEALSDGPGTPRPTPPQGN